MVKRVKEFILRILNKIIPQRVLVIKSKCLLRDDCDYKIQATIFTPQDDFNIEDILDMFFRAMADHLKKNHKVDFFVGLEFKTDNARYIIQGLPPAVK